MSFDDLFLGEFILINEKKTSDYRMSDELKEVIQEFAENLEVTPESINLSNNDGYVIHYRHSNPKIGNLSENIDQEKLQELNIKLMGYEFISNNSEYKMIIDRVTDFDGRYGIYFYMYKR